MPTGPCPHLAVNLHCTWTARTLPVVTVETTTRRTCVVLSTILRLLYFGQALYYMLTDIITFSHPRILQVWKLLWSPFCIQENANFKRLKNLQGHTSQKWCTHNLNSHTQFWIPNSLSHVSLSALRHPPALIAPLGLFLPLLFPFSMFAFSLFSINSFLILNLLSSR